MHCIFPFNFPLLNERISVFRAATMAILFLRPFSQLKLIPSSASLIKTSPNCKMVENYRSSHGNIERSSATPVLGYINKEVTYLTFLNRKARSLVAEEESSALVERLMIDSDGTVGDFDSADVAALVLEEETGVEEGVEVAEAEVGGGAVAAEGVEVAAADEDELRHAERGGAAS